MSFARLQAPAEDGEWLAHPDPGEWRRLLDRNRSLVSSSTATVGGLPFSTWRELVRSEVAACCGARDGFGDKPLIVSGHQPELFHPGVWIKNFAAAGFGRSVDGVGVHIVADSDLIKRTTAAVPAGTFEAPLVAHVPFDAWTGEEPYEDRPVRDEGVFRRFGEETSKYLAALPFQSLFPRFWEFGVLPYGRTVPLADRFSGARNVFEREWGSNAIETSLGRCCRAPHRGFTHLVAEIVARAAEYQSIYNEELLAFRKANKVRSAHHPAPALETTDAGAEIPFWVSKPGVRRRRPFVLVRSGSLRLSAGGETIVEIERNENQVGTEAIVDALASVTDWNVRPRALMTTTFLRLGLSDLFIHGLGGAKYDEWNDAVIRRFFNLEPPAYVMLTATLRLPLARADADSRQDVRELQRRRRDLEWNPERHLDDVLLEREPICNWVEEKTSLFEQESATKAERRARHRRFRELNEKLREFVAVQIDETSALLQQAESAAEAAALMGSREFFFGFHPPQSLLALVKPWLEWQSPPPARGSAAPSSL